MEGERLGTYLIDRELGAGGMGKVYAATGPDGVVALKVVHPHLLEAEGFFKRFLREAQLGQAIRHENVVRTLDCDQEFGRDKPQCFLVMEYVEGQTLSELLAELERVPEELCRHVAREICKGLSAIHDAGVVHRDLKPENVLITADHVVKVMDLGVARLADEALRLSKTGAFVGSVEYAAPEQFKGGEVDGRTDLHALGLLLYELSSGTHPYRGGSFHEVLGRVCDEAPRRIGEINSQLSPFFEEVVHTLLVKDPRGRFASATQVLGVLEEGEDSSWWRERARLLQAETERPLRRIRIPRDTAVYGRDAELAILHEAFDAAKSGDGQLVLIEGEAGIGKSRLVDELVTRLQSDGEELNFLFGSYPPGGAAAANGAFSAAFREHFGESGSARHLLDNHTLVPAFDALLRGDGTPAAAQPLTPGSLHTCFVRATQSLAAQRVTVVLIDDLHFAPDEGRALFSSLAMALPGHRVLLIGSTRPGLSDAWRAGLTRLDHTTSLPLARLGPKDLVRLLGESLRSRKLAEELAGTIAVKSDGNPFFAFEIIRGLREQRFISQTDDGSWVSTGRIDEIGTPSSVLDLVNARVSDLTEEERDLLDVACCWGFEFDPGLVGDVLGLGRIPVLKSFGQIERRNRLVRASGRHYVFDHHQVQEALYRTLHQQLREEYHAALADALATRVNAAEEDPVSLGGALCVELCEHYLEGSRGADALRYLPAAERHLAEGYLSAEAVALVERALAVPGVLSGIERAEALVRLCAARGPLDLLGRRARGEECAREAERLAEAAGSDGVRRAAAHALGWTLHRMAREDEAAAALRRALELARDLGDRWAEAAALGNLGSVFQTQQRLEAAREHHERSLAIFRELGDRAGEARATGLLAIVCYSEGHFVEALDCAERDLALHRAVGDRLGESVATGNVGAVLGALGRPAEARAHHERHLALSREIGDRNGEASSLGNLGSALHGLGRLKESRELLELQLEITRELGLAEDEATAEYNLGRVLGEEGDGAGSKEHLLAGLLLCQAIECPHVATVTHLALGSLRATQSRSDGGDEEGARESLAAARDLAVEHDLVAQETLARCELALLSGGDAEDALASFTEHGERLSSAERQSARFLLWKATGEVEHLEEAKRLLDGSLANVPPDCQEAMLTNLRLNRETMAAWNAKRGSSDDSDDDEPRGVEPATRVG